ncbi:MAG: reprolysin-like metallopeptidase [Acidobacteriota bacterium]
MKKSKQQSAPLRQRPGSIHPRFRLAFVIGLCLLAATYAALSRLRSADAAAVAGQDSPDGVWRSSLAETVGLTAVQGVSPSSPVFQLDGATLRNLLSRAPMEFTAPLAASPVALAVPGPDGSFVRFRLQESPIMEPALAAKFPEIKTYLGQGIDDPTATLRCDLTPHGFHAMVFSAEGTFFVEPVRSDVRYYRSYFKQGQEKDWQCFTDQNDVASPTTPLGTPYVLSGATLRTYRLALAATGEYTAFHGGTVALALAAMVTSMNRVNGVYEREVGVRMIMVANNNLIVYTNSATDPYTNSSGSAMLGQNQTNLDSVIGSASYDIGHVFSTGGGGVATLNSVCVNGSKARGVTGSSSPVGDGFDIDYVAHEMGHQFGGRHTFNGTTSNCGGGNRSASAAYEPGSGSTIMAYAGICGAENLQPNSDAYFHVKSLEEILAFIGGTGGNCAVATPTGNITPTVSAGASFTIPQSTPFTLTASGSDADGDALTFCWEQFDLGTAAPPNTDNGSRPIFRSFTGTTNVSRTFPKLSDILNNTATIGESFPLTTRAMNFRVTARDNRAGGGGVRDAAVTINSRADSGPFVVTAPNSAINWSGGAIQTVTWNVANTDAAPVSCAQVNILLSTDGGLTFPTTLLAATPNNGTASVVVPSTPTTQARVKIAAVGNVFFDISNANFTITAIGGGCSYALNPTSQNFAALGSANTVNVTTGAGCGWAAKSNAAWISVITGAEGTGSGMVGYSVAANLGAQRTGTMTIGEQIFTVTQDGAAGGVNGLQFYPLATPIRLLDTRAGQGNCDNISTPITGGTSLTTLARITCQNVTIPPTAQAITGNLTVINQTAQTGYLTIYPDGQAAPLAANMVYEQGGILANNFTVGLSSDGRFNVFGERTIDVVVDISGYYAPPGAGGLYYHPLPNPVRLLDTRGNQGNCDNVSTPISAGASITTQARTTCETLTIPAAAQAIAGNATVINGSGQLGYLTIYPNGVASPLAANMVYFPGQILSNAFTVNLNASGEFNIFAERTVDMVVDVAGYYSSEPVDVNGAGLLFTPLPRPLRILDTRPGQGNCDAVSTPIAGGSSIAAPARLTCETITIPATAQSVLGNITVINQTASPGYLTLYSDGAAQPLAANMVYAPGQILANAFAIGVNAVTGQYRIFGERTIDAIVDVSGYFAP